MDTTEKNIIMLEKAEEIQESWKPRVGDWFYKRDGVGFGLWLICKLEEDILLCSGERMNQAPFDGQFVVFRVPENYIWLPHQGQLQEMIGLSPEIWSGTVQLLWEFTRSIVNKKQELLIASMEQLLEAFVMKEKYNKVWNGEDWKESNDRN